jgi:hypothetical protein
MSGRLLDIVAGSIWSLLRSPIQPHPVLENIKDCLLDRHDLVDTHRKERNVHLAIFTTHALHESVEELTWGRGRE